jgi:DNA-binding transcriptional LysR family regulator
VELHQLQCFMLVVEEGGLKRATAQLHITQPALSYQIKQLEEELGVQLFHRRPGGNTPTEAGRVLLQHAHQIINAVHEAQQAVRELSDGVTGEIRIGTINSVGTYFLPQILWELRSNHPKVTPRLLYRNSIELVEALLANKIDVALVADPPHDKRLRYDCVVEEEISLVSGVSHPFFGRASIEPAELQGAQFVALSPHTLTGGLVHRYLERLGIAVEPVVSTDSIETVKRMVEAGMGVAFLPDMVTSEDLGSDGQPPRLSRTAVEPPLSRRIVLATWRDTNHSRAVDAFVREVRKLGRRWKSCDY